MRYDLTSVRMAVIKERKDNKSQQEYGEEGSLVPSLLMECKLIVPLWKRAKDFLED